MSWQVQINHTWREGNKSADWLANFSLSLDFFDLHIIETLLLESFNVFFFFFYDIFGTCMSRDVCLIAYFFFLDSTLFLYQTKIVFMV